jgi:hypothetical protein
MPLFEMHKIEDVFGPMYDGYSRPGTKTDLNVIPAANLTRNIGFGMDATHAKKSDPLGAIRADTMAFPIRHPFEITP